MRSLLIVSFLFLSPLLVSAEDGLTVSFLKVGLGDSILITCPGAEHRALIDGGDSNSGYPEAESLFYQAIKERVGESGKIQTVINTHPHPDHTYNLLSLVQSGKFGIERYVDNGGDFINSDTEEKIRDTLKKKEIKYVDAFKEKPKSLDICPKAKDLNFEFVWLSGDSLEELGCPQNLNDCSLVTRITFKGVSALLLADVSEGWERKALNENLLKREDIVKVGHHASPVSVYRGAWEVIKPKLAVVTAGEPEKGRSNSLGYPSEDTLLKLKEILIDNGSENFEVKGCKKLGMKCDWITIAGPIASTQQQSLDLSLEKGTFRINTSTR